VEFTKEIKVEIEKGTNKSTTKVGLSLGEYNEDETIEDFVQRVKDYLNDMLIDRA